MLDGADVLINTYWIRFPHGGVEFSDAIGNSALLFDTAREAGVERIVHVSVSNPSPGSSLGYYAGKARVEELLQATGPSWAIVRPTLVAGPNDVLSGNIAWFVRRFPVIAVPRGGGHRLQPVHVEDVGSLLARLAEREDDVVLDAAGPDVLTFEDYVRLIGEAVGRRTRLVPMPPRVMLGALWATGLLLRDTILTREELEGLRQDLLVSHGRGTCPTSVVDWLRDHGDEHLGRRYVNDTRTRFR